MRLKNAVAPENVRDIVAPLEFLSDSIFSGQFLLDKARCFDSKPLWDYDDTHRIPRDDVAGLNIDTAASDPLPERIDGLATRRVDRRDSPGEERKRQRADLLNVAR